MSAPIVFILSYCQGKLSAIMNENAAITPLKGTLHRLPGTSTRDRFFDLLTGKGAAYILAGLSGVLLACQEWARYLTGTEPSLGTLICLTLLAVILAGVVGWRFTSALGEEKQVVLAREGEITTRQALERLRSAGYYVFHDIPADGFNIHHVLIGASGIYAIETIARQKRRPDARVSYDEQKVWVDGSEPDRNPIQQATAQADWVREKLRESTGIQFPVRPVVVFPGWFVNQPSQPWRQYVWVLTEKHLPSFLAHQRVRIKMADVHLAKSRVACWARSEAD